MTEHKDLFTSNIIGSILIVFLTSTLGFFTYLITELDEIQDTQAKGVEIVVQLKELDEEVTDHESRLRILEAREYKR